MNRIVAAMHKKMHGFSLAEALIVMLIITIVALVSAPVITKKRRLMDANSVHGKWACKNVNGTLKSSTAKNVDDDFDTWKTGCNFPLLPKNVKFLFVEVFGAGGGASRGFALPWESYMRSYNIGARDTIEGEYHVDFIPSLNDYQYVLPRWSDGSAGQEDIEKYFDVDTSHELYTKYMAGENNLRTNTYATFYKGDEYQQSTGLKYAKCQYYSYAANQCSVGEQTPKNCLPVEEKTASKVKWQDCDCSDSEASTKPGTQVYCKKKEKTEWKRTDTSAACTCPSGTTSECTKEEGDGENKTEYTCKKNTSYYWETDKSPYTSCSAPTDTTLTQYLYDKKCQKKVDVDFLYYTKIDNKWDWTQSQLNNAKNQTFYYCYTDSYFHSDAPPNEYNTSSSLLSACEVDGQADYKENFSACEQKGNDILLYRKGYKTVAIGTLTSAYVPTPQNVGIRGQLHLKEGETLDWEVDNEPTAVNSDESSSYPLMKQTYYTKDPETGKYKYINDYKKTAKRKNGNTIKLYHYKSTLSGSGINESKALVATFYGPTVGRLGLTSGNKCCDNCGSVAGYPNSSGKNRSQCATNSGDVTVVIAPAYRDRFEEAEVTSSVMKIQDERFISYTGCYGNNGGEPVVSMMAASSNGEYKFGVGKGGTGAQGLEDNTITKSATAGEKTYFGWLSAAGGAPAPDGCTSRDVDVEDKEPSTNPYDSSLGLGGNKGTVYNYNAKRNYTLSPLEDIIPEGRWRVNNGGNGTGGMIVVSW